MAEKALKKAAKKMAKKAAKKGAKHAHGERGHGNSDLRRAYEHMGRLTTLRPLLDEEGAVRIVMLSELAQQSLEHEDMKSSAELLRAAEHISFGRIFERQMEPEVGEALQQAIDDEFEHLRRRIHDHLRRESVGRGDTRETILDVLLDEAEAAYGRESFRCALELARAAEALTHVHSVPKRIGTERQTRNLPRW